MRRHADLVQLLGNQFRARILLLALVFLFVHGVDCTAESFHDHDGEINLERKAFEKRFFAYHDDDERNKEKVDEYLAKVVVGEKVRADWNNLKKLKPRVLIEIPNGNLVKFLTSDRLAMKEVFHFLQFFPLLFDTDVMVFRIPIDDRVSITLQFENKADGTFTVFYRSKHPMEKQDLSDVKLISAVLNKAFPNDEDKREFTDLVQEMYIAKLNSIGDIVEDVKTKELAVVFMTVTSILKKDFSLLGPDAYWLKEIDDLLQPTRESMMESTDREIRYENTTRIMYELTASMLQRLKDDKISWQSLHKPIVVDTDPSTTGVTINAPYDITLRAMFKHLQSFVELYPDAGTQNIQFKLPIGGSDKVFYLSISTYGENQIFVNTKDSDWPGSTKRSHYDSGYWGPDYNTMVDELKDFPDQLNLAHVMIEACQSNLNINDQPNFSESLRMPGNEEKTANMIRHTVEFLVITMVAEAATPTDPTKAKFIELMADTIDETGHFPEQSTMPQLGYLGPGLKTGRSPTADDIALGLLYIMRDEDIGIDVAFSDDNYPIRQKGGTQLGREYLYDYGDDMIPSYLIQKLATGITQRAIRSYTTTN